MDVMSAQVFFIGDTHFGHKNIIKFGRNQFQTIQEHNEFLVDAWNSVVKPKDIVYHMGDVAFGLENLRYIRYCNGNKHLVKGNHDNLLITDYVEAGFRRIEGCMKYKEFVMTHVPIHPSCLEFSWKLNLHGHIHDPLKNIPDPRYINVGADNIGLIPISLEEIRENLKKY